MWQPPPTTWSGAGAAGRGAGRGPGPHPLLANLRGRPRLRRGDAGEPARRVRLPHPAGGTAEDPGGAVGLERFPEPRPSRKGPYPGDGGRRPRPGAGLPAGGGAAGAGPGRAEGDDGAPAQPALARSFFHDRGIPTIPRGSREGAGADRRAARAPARADPEQYNAYRGIALNDCVRESKRAAERIANAI